MSDPLREKSYEFARRIVKLSEFLHRDKHEYVLSKKVLDSGVNVGLFIEEGKQGESREDFRAKYAVANKEAFKTSFLLKLLRDEGLIGVAHANDMIADCNELQSMLISTLKTTTPKVPRS